MIPLLQDLRFAFRRLRTSPGHTVHGMVVRQGMALAVAGLALGLGAALATARLLESLLFDISTSDLSTFTAVSAVLAVAAYLAVQAPALRASRVDPMAVLREE